MENLELLVWAILGLPILGFLFQSFFGGSILRRLGDKTGKRVLGIFAVGPIALSFVAGALAMQELVATAPAQRSVVVTGPAWIDTLGIKVPFEFLLDPLSMTMVLIITGIGALIHLYATGYMAEDKDYPRFFSYLNLFVVAMLVLVLGNNLPLLFVGWEGVGLCSYLLIGFWYHDLENAKAANKAFIVNRIGDWGLALGMFLIVVATMTTDLGKNISDGRILSYDNILPMLEVILKSNPGLATAIGLLLFVGACGKSAQFPLYLWLPDAMAGPTPVSALIHAATMVTSGVVLLNRMHVVFEMSPIASGVIVVVGAFTAVFAALIAFGQTDIKKVLAYSTVSQLGFMFIACGAGAYWAGMFHVTTHAFFKALLFLGAGAVIHAMAHEQDMRHYGGLAKYLPITCLTMVIGWLAISGVPGLSGFFSKEAILGAALDNKHALLSGYNVSVLAGWIGLFTALLTAFYMTRMTLMTFMGKPRWTELAVAHHAHQDGDDHAQDGHGHDDHAADDHHHGLTGDHKPREVPFSMWFPLVVLALLSVGGGYLMHHEEVFYRWLYPNGLPVLGEVSTHPHHLPFGLNLMALSIAATVLGIGAGLAIYLKGLPAKEGWDESKWSKFRLAAAKQFGFDGGVVTAAVAGGGEFARGVASSLERGLVEGAGSGVTSVADGIGEGIRKVQTGYVRFYALIMVVGTLALSAYLIWGTINGGKS